MVGDLMKAVAEMTAKEVFAGFPESGEPHKDENGNPTAITNAALGYIHNFGEPAHNIPARPFMNEGIEDVQGRIVDLMQQVGDAALEGDSQRVDRGLHAVGLTAKLGIQNKILNGPFEPLAESTLKARAHRGQPGAQDELDRRATGEDPGTDLARPLNDTGQMRNAVNYAIRSK